MLRIRRTAWSYALLTLLCGLLCVNIWLHVQSMGSGAGRSQTQVVAWSRRADGAEGMGTDVAKWAAMCDRCMVNPELCGKYGRYVPHSFEETAVRASELYKTSGDRMLIHRSSNVDLSRAFEGTGGRVQRVLKMAMSGQPVKIAGIGGSSMSPTPARIARPIVIGRIYGWRGH